LDAPFAEEKIRRGSLLHNQLLQKASYLFGVDIDSEVLNLYRQLTGDQQNILYDIQRQGPFPSQLIKQYQIILFPEVLEHLPEPGRAIRNLAKLCQQNPDSQLCLSVPNALSAVGFFSGMQGVELVHPDHYYYFSPYTLKHILLDHGFQQISLYLYSSRNLIDTPGLSKHGIIAVCEP
jgi:2-polyprenyl-3-methyl-5-hydroxy-6-metoxy-1,4-benzoquinol methylase